jgi:hypothetical protein
LVAVNKELSLEDREERYVLIPLGFQGGKKEAKVMGKLVKCAAIRRKACALTLGPRLLLVTEKKADMLGKVHGIGTWMAIGPRFR